MGGRKRQSQGAISGRDLFVESTFFSTPESYAEWLCDFLRQDLDRPASEVDLRRKAFDFISVGEGAVIDLTPAGGLADDHLPTMAVLRDLQQEVATGISTVRAGNWWVVPPITYGLARLGSRLIRGHRQGPFRSLFLAAAADAVQESWQRLWECPRCHHLFVKVGKQRYCSAACSQRTRWDRYKGKRPPRDYRLERENANRKRLGANVKVGRRKSGRSGPSS